MTCFLLWRYRVTSVTQNRDRHFPFERYSVLLEYFICIDIGFCRVGLEILKKKKTRSPVVENCIIESLPSCFSIALLTSDQYDLLSHEKMSYFAIVV